MSFSKIQSKARLEFVDKGSNDGRWFDIAATRIERLDCGANCVWGAKDCTWDGDAEGGTDTGDAVAGDAVGGTDTGDLVVGDSVGSAETGDAVTWDWVGTNETGDAVGGMEGSCALAGSTELGMPVASAAGVEIGTGTVHLVGDTVGVIEVSPTGGVVLLLGDAKGAEVSGKRVEGFDVKEFISCSVREAEACLLQSTNRHVATPISTPAHAIIPSSVTRETLVLDSAFWFAEVEAVTFIVHDFDRSTNCENHAVCI